MESWEKEHIRNNHHFLVENTKCSEALLTTLTNKNVISEEDKQEIVSQPDAEKSYKLYATVLDRKVGYTGLTEALAATKQTRVHRILQQRTGVSLLKRYKSIEYDKNYVLGRGVNSVVYKGWMGVRDVAVKRLNRMSLGANKAVDDVSILKDLAAQPNIVQYLVTYEKPEYLLIATELCNGSLEDCIKDKFFPLDKREILRQATTGLGCLHANNIIHGDLKPANVLMSSTSGNKTLVKISDFGRPKTFDYHRRSPSACALNWIPPEILRFCDEDTREDPQTPNWTLKSDIFPLGCIYYYVISEGKHPFGSGFRIDVNILEGKYALPDDTEGLMNNFRSLIEKMICTDPAGRSTCEEILSSECLVPTHSMQSSRDEHRSSSLEAVTATAKPTISQAQSDTERATKKLGLGTSAHGGTLKSQAATTTTRTRLGLSITNDQREYQNVVGTDIATSPQIKFIAKGTSENGNKLDITKMLLIKPGEEAPSRCKSMETWQRHYIFNNINDLHQHVIRKEKFLEELVRNNVLSKMEAARCKFLWPKFFDTWAFGDSAVGTMALFELISRRIDSYELLMDVLRETCDSKNFEKLKKEQDLVKGLLTSDRFLKASYAIAMLYDADKITALLPELSNSNRTKLLGKNGESLLHVAVGCGHVPMIHKLHSMGIVMSCQDVDRNYPHHYLGKWSSNVIEVTRALLEVGTDISTKNEAGETVAHAVAVNISSPKEFHDWCQFMIEINMEKFPIENNIWKQSSLYYAVACFEILKKTLVLLKEKGLPLNQRATDGRGFLQYAALFGRTKTTIEALVKCGVDWNYSDYFGRTVLHFAVWGGKTETVEHILKLGANVNIKDICSRTPLHYLREAYVNHVEITKLLVANGAKLTEVDAYGDTPAHDRRSWGERKEEYREWTKYLLESGLVTESYFWQKNNNGELPLPPL